MLGFWDAGEIIEYPLNAGMIPVPRSQQFQGYQVPVPHHHKPRGRDFPSRASAGVEADSMLLAPSLYGFRSAADKVLGLLQADRVAGPEQDRRRPFVGAGHAAPPSRPRAASYSTWASPTPTRNFVPRPEASASPPPSPCCVAVVCLTVSKKITVEFDSCL